MGIEDHPAWRAREARRLKEKLEKVKPTERVAVTSAEFYGLVPEYGSGCVTVSQDPTIITCQVNEGAAE